MDRQFLEETGQRHAEGQEAIQMLRRDAEKARRAFRVPRTKFAPKS